MNKPFHLRGCLDRKYGCIGSTYFLNIFTLLKSQESRTRERKGAQIFASVKRHKKDCANLNKNLT